MACCFETSWEQWTQNLDDQKDEVLALESIFEDTDRFRVLFSPDDDSGQYTLQVNIPTVVSEEGTVIQGWMPCEDKTSLPELQVEDVPPNVRPQFQRTESGHRWHSSFHVSYLPPLCLQVILPQTYPSDAPPIFTLSCLWLDGLKLSALCKQLDTLWTENEGSPILYTWIDWLENNTVRYLGLESGVILVPHQEGSEDMFGDSRAIPECENLQEDLVKLLWFDLQHEWSAFRGNPQSCNICFEQKPGVQFHRLQDCRHHFCHECMKAYCDHHVAEGTIQQLLCPEADCKQTLPPSILKAVLGKQDYIRWEKLLLQRTLDTMGDVVWCPRCSFAVIQEKEENLQLAHCTNCWYSFCANCRDPWHQGSKCKTIEEHMAELEKESIEDEEEDFSEAAMQRRRRIQKKLDYMSCMMVKKTTKPCPKCRAPIEKNHGCNHVTCTCGTAMCWVCGRRVSGYDHFRSSRCALFPGQEEMYPYNVWHPPIPRWERPVNPEAERVREAMHNPRAADRLFPCPRCRQRNLREGRNNHIRCWACRANVCFACRGLIDGVVSAHYRAGMPCNQHSD